MPDAPSRRAESFPSLDEAQVRRWDRFLRTGRAVFPVFVGMQLEEVRKGYARVRLPYRPEVCQPSGVIHGGALAAVVDTAAVPAVANFYDVEPDMVTVSLTVNFCGAVRDSDAVGEAWVEQGGRSMAFVRAEVRGGDGTLAVTATSVFRLRPQPPSG